MLCEEHKERFKRLLNFTCEIRERILFDIQTKQGPLMQIIDLFRKEHRPRVCHKRICQFIRSDRKAVRFIRTCSMHSYIASVRYGAGRSR